MEKKKVHLAELYPVIADVLKQDGSVILPVTGTSMVPTIRGGRDQVTLVRAQGPLKKYDLPLYRRKSGQFVLHRVISVEKDGSYTCCGDHQWKKEPGIQPEQIIGIVSEFERKGKRIDVRDGGYRRYVRFWVTIRPIRCAILTAAGWLSRLKRAILRK